MGRRAPLIWCPSLHNCTNVWDTARPAHPNIVLVSVEQDHRVSQDVHSVCILEEVGALLVVVLAKALHDAIDFLCLSRKPEALQVQPNGHVKGQPCMRGAVSTATWTSCKPSKL